ncbi:cytochrome c oxidase subunit I [Fulvimarina endophytica]|uniref:cytochrome-c oxidase n=1 Tax=Fulvimarina endophytica TaxID=2293836 RepID=A0A371X7V1_9HYPH|nr:cytochrome c oxidase subunit I [Fulvimarina endophytica]RFC65290.1 cytochrome c oxidase subunit I [Fulvimarina endophytica]
MNAIGRHRGLARIWAGEPGLRGVFSAVSHTDIGKRFIIASAIFFAIAGVLAMLIRAQLATSHSAFVGPEAYAQIFTMHGSIMMFLFAIPMLEGVAIYLLPKLLGSRDLAFPRLTALGWWCYLFGGSIMVGSLLVGLAPNAGWFLYPPLSGPEYTPGVNSDVWLLGVTFVEISAMCAAIEIVVTILKFRAKGMRLDRMPIYAWYILATAGMMIFGFPPLILGSILLEIERAFGWPFFDPELGGSPLLWQHLFWLFGHPEVYIIFLPAAGAISTIIPVMARTKLIGYGAIVASVMALAFLSFGLWVHHMFTTGIPHMALGFFSAASVLVAIPTSIQIFAWLGTLWAGRPKLELPMLYLLGFFFVFILGGLTGVMLAIVPFNQQAHDTAFVTAHLHYVLAGGFVFPMLAAAYYWMPHVTGRLRVMRIGEAAFWLIFIGFNITFFGMHLTGLLGMPRRVYTYPAEAGWDWLNLVSSIGGFLQAFGFALFALDIALQAWLGRPARRNPWGAGTLEWTMMTPPPAYNFASLPEVECREPLGARGTLAADLARGEGLLAAPRNGWRETLAVDIASGKPDHVAILPGPSLLPVAAAASFGGFFAMMLLSLYWIAPLFLVAVTVVIWLWASTNGSREPVGPLEIGDGTTVPSHYEAQGTVGYWGSVFALCASGTLFGSLIFGFAYLWTVAPHWPPQTGLDAPLFETGLIVAGALAAAIFVRLALPRTGNGEGRLYLAIAGMGLTLLVLASLPVLRLPAPTDHAFGAVSTTLVAYGLFHAMVATLILAFMMVRKRQGFVAHGRPQEMRVATLWVDYAAGTAIVVALVLVLAAWGV